MALHTFMSLHSILTWLSPVFTCTYYKIDLLPAAPVFICGHPKDAVSLGYCWENSGCFNKLRGMGDGGAAFGLPGAGQAESIGHSGTCAYCRMGARESWGALSTVLS